MSNKAFQEFLNHLAPTYGLPSLRPDQMGACQLLLKKEQLLLLFEYDDYVVPNTILLSTSLGELGPETNNALFTKLLKENQGGDKIISLQPDEPIVFLHMRLAPEITQEPLQNELHAFTEMAKRCNNTLYNATHEDDKAPSSEAGQIFSHKKV